MKFFIIPGYKGNPEENWFPWLKEELEKLGHEVIVPRFPEGVVFDEWKKVMDEFVIENDDIFVAHSLGPSFVLNILQEHKVKACFFVASFVGELGSDLDAVLLDISQREIDFEKVKKNCKKFLLFNSNDDPHVPLQKGLELMSLLDCELRIVKNAGHMNAKSGYLKFDKLFNEIKKIL